MEMNNFLKEYDEHLDEIIEKEKRIAVLRERLMQLTRQFYKELEEKQ